MQQDQTTSSLPSSSERSSSSAPQTEEAREGTHSTLPVASFFFDHPLNLLTYMQVASVYHLYSAHFFEHASLDLYVLDSSAPLAFPL
jgi:hypothetical protein